MQGGRGRIEEKGEDKDKQEILQSQQKKRRDNPGVRWQLQGAIFSADVVFTSKNLIKKLNTIQRLCNSQLTDGTDHVSSNNFGMDCMRRFDGAYVKINLSTTVSLGVRTK